jgi:AcrB/AcrD/AcrF family
MRITRAFVGTITVLLIIGYVGLASFPVTLAVAQPTTATSNVAVGPQYDTTHVYVAPTEFDRFVASVVATFGGTASKKGVFTVTPTPSKTMSQLVLTPVGTFSVFGFETPIPYPFGSERTGYLVTDMASALRAAHATGADILVSPFNDPIGRDAIIQWPGGVTTQLYWHTIAPSYAALQMIPETRVYVSVYAVKVFTTSFLKFSHGEVISDDKPFVIMMAVPGTLAGVLWMLALTGTTINVESLMGAIMAVGVGVANGNLVVIFANELREQGYTPVAAVIEAARTRLRPVIMTALAMVLGMLPMALALGEGGEQNAPLGRAVIGGLVVATLMTLFVVPAAYSAFGRNVKGLHQRDAEIEAVTSPGA